MSDMTTGSAALAGNPASDPAAGATGGDAGQQNITQVGLPGTPDGATSSTAPTSTGTWLDSIEDSELKGYVSNKGWSDPALFSWPDFKALIPLYLSVSSINACHKGRLH